MECAVILEEDIVDVCGCSLPLRGRLSVRCIRLGPSNLGEDLEDMHKWRKQSSWGRIR